LNPLLKFEARTGQTTMSSHKRYVIVVGIDYSELSRMALRQAFQVASERTPSEVHVLHVSTRVDGYPHAGSDAPAPNDELVVRGLERLQRLVRTDLGVFFGTGDGAGRLPFGVVSHIRSGSAASQIAQLADDVRADLVVVGTQGHTGITRLLLGSVAHGVVSLAPCTVLVVRDRNFAQAAPVRSAHQDALQGSEAVAEPGAKGN